MKRLLLTLLTALMLTGPAWAEWVLVSQNDSADFYIDPETIRKDGNLVKVWEVQNLTQPSIRGALSRRARSEYDCKQERRKTLSISAHSEPMAGGTTILDSTPDSGWREIPPGTVAQTIFQIVCAR